VNVSSRSCSKTKIKIDEIPRPLDGPPGAGINVMGTLYVLYFRIRGGTLCVPKPSSPTPPQLPKNEPRRAQVIPTLQAYEVRHVPSAAAGNTIL
jgi:hypothetical protein